MADHGITINGQHFASPDDMPPDVRRQYDEAMRLMRPDAAGPGGTTDVQTHSSGFGLSSNIVIRKTITMNGQTYKSIDEMPPEARQQIERVLKAQGLTGSTPPAPGVYEAIEIRKPKALDRAAGAPPAAPYVPIEPSNFPFKVRDFVGGLIFWVVVGLVVLAFLSRR